MIGLADTAFSILRQIAGGKRTFQVISKKVADMICIPDAINLTDAEAENIKGDLYRLHHAGLIVILDEMPSGHIHIDRITPKGRDLLNKTNIR